MGDTHIEDHKSTTLNSPRAFTYVTGSANIGRGIICIHRWFRNTEITSSLQLIVTSADKQLSHWSKPVKKLKVKMALDVKIALKVK